MAAQRARLNVKLVEKSPAPEYKILPEKYAETIDAVKRDTGKPPALALLTYPDGNYGNLADAKAIANVVHDNGVPFLVNGAYAIGRMPFNAKQLGADFVSGSGHKSMASSGPIGVLGASNEFAPLVFAKSPTHKTKEIESLGCTARGATAMTMLASFPAVYERTKPERWQHELDDARWFSLQLENLDLKQFGDRPHNHDLMFFEATPFFDIYQKTDRYFLYREMKARGIHGIKPGLTKNFKLSTFGVGCENLGKVVDAFKEILQKYSQ